MILQSLEALESDLETFQSRSYYLILGPELYQCRLAIDLIKNRILNPEEAAFDYYSYSIKETQDEKIFETANTFPMLAKRKLVLVNDLEILSDSRQEKALHVLESLPPQSLVILFAEELDHRKKFYKTIREKGCIVEFPKLKGAALEHWADNFILTKGYRASSTTIRKILNLAGSDLQTLVGEMEKLFLFSGKDKNINDAAINDLVRSSRQHGIFELIDSIARHDRAGALTSLANLLDMGEYPLGIVAMMARHSRQVFIIKECIKNGMNNKDAGAIAQIPPFILDKFIGQARKTDSETVRGMHIQLAEIDRRLKSSALDARILLEAFICALV